MDNIGFFFICLTICTFGIIRWYFFTVSQAERQQEKNESKYNGKYIFDIKDLVKVKVNNNNGMVIGRKSKIYLGDSCYKYIKPQYHIRLMNNTTHWFHEFELKEIRNNLDRKN